MVWPASCCSWPVRSSSLALLLARHVHLVWFFPWAPGWYMYAPQTRDTLRSFAQAVRTPGISRYWCTLLCPQGSLAVLRRPLEVSVSGLLQQAPSCGPGPQGSPHSAMRDEGTEPSANCSCHRTAVTAAASPPVGPLSFLSIHGDHGPSSLGAHESLPPGASQHSASENLAVFIAVFVFSVTSLHLVLRF